MDIAISNSLLHCIFLSVCMCIGLSVIHSNLLICCFSHFTNLQANKLCYFCYLSVNKFHLSICLFVCQSVCLSTQYKWIAYIKFEIYKRLPLPVKVLCWLCETYKNLFLISVSWCFGTANIRIGIAMLCYSEYQYRYRAIYVFSISFTTLIPMSTYTDVLFIAYT